MEAGHGIQLSMSSNIWSSAEVNKTHRKDQDFQISSTIIISYKNLWKTTISQEQISKNNSSCSKQVIHFLKAGFSPKISLKPQFSRNKHSLEDGVQCSHSGKSHLFPNHWSVLSLALALKIGWQILTQAGLPKQVINIFLFHFSDPDKVWVQHRPCLHWTLWGDPLDSHGELDWNFFGIQAVTSLALNETCFFQLHDIILAS